jgi:pyruvate dehydrogenase E1 component
MGDAEMDEGNVHEALLEYWKHGLKNCWWVVDYNRQSLDSVVSDQLFMKVAGLFDNLGWKVVFIKYGKLLEAAFREPGGERLRQWINECPNQLYSALVFEGAKGWRRQLEDELSGHPETLAIINRRDDAELAKLMTNLGGHDLESILEAFAGAPEDQPVCFIAYTIKGFGLPFQGHKDNHAGLMNKTQMQEFRVGQGINQGEEWDRFAGLAISSQEVEAYLKRVPFVQKGTRRLSAPRIPVPDMPILETKGKAATQAGFGRLLDELARAGGSLADRILTTSADVTVSTNLGPWVNRRGLFSMESKEDVFKQRGLMSPQRWEMSLQVLAAGDHAHFFAVGVVGQKPEGFIQRRRSDQLEGFHFAPPFLAKRARPSSTLSAVKGKERRRTPQALKIALAIALCPGTIAGSAMPITPRVSSSSIKGTISGISAQPAIL